MRQRLLRMWLALGVATGLLLWPREAILGTYGSYTLLRRGFTLATDINVGSYSVPTHEAEVFHERETAIAAQVKPHLAMYDAWYKRVGTGQHAYRGYLGALDAERTTQKQWDYKSRLPGPLPRPQTSAVSALIEPIMLTGPADRNWPQIYLHMRPSATPLAHGRALVGFTLAQLALGEDPGFVFPPAAVGGLSERLARVSRGDSFGGQAILLSALLFDVRARQPELAQLVEDPAATKESRLLAGLVLRGLRHEPFAPADWQRLEAAKKIIDQRTLWTWALLFCPDSAQAAHEDQLRQRLPLSDEHNNYFYRQFVKGEPE